LREGVWTGNGYSPKLKLVNVPVLKHHGGCGVTAAVKHYYGVLSMGYRPLDYHYGELGLAVGEMMTKVRGPVLNILDAIWISPVNHYGLPQDVQRLNILGASLDPVALDYWGCKHVLYPAATNPEHNPDLFQPLGHYLEQARDTINKNGGLFGRQVNLGDENTELVSYASVIDQVLQAATRNEVNGDIADRMKERADAGM
jgi:hypothetical protein